MDNAIPGRTLTSLSIIIPFFNEEEVLNEFRIRLDKVLASLTCKSEIICVSDGSTDNTERLLGNWASENPAVKLIFLSRNFGQQAAFTAGLDSASADAVVTMDGDLQDPPELILKFIDAYEKGFDVIYAKRIERHGESLIKRITANLFYRGMKMCVDNRMLLDVGEYRLMSRGAVDAIVGMRERHRYLRGMAAWAGFPQLALEYERPARVAGKTKFGFTKMIYLSFDAIFSSSTLPLRFSVVLGVLVVLFGLCYAVYAIGKLLLGDTVRGWTALVVLILVIGGTILVSLGLIGEYVARIYEEVKRRPIYIVKNRRNF
jgi:glycosyltransferase involved in cell wall biosynthesis